jgi:flagellar motor protein MotB
MKREVSQRWALSFADLAMMLLAFFVMMQAQSNDRLKFAASMRGAFGGTGPGVRIDGYRAAAIFESGEAILTPASRAAFARLGASAKRSGARVTVASQGHDAGSTRLDAWELTAARTAAVARAIGAGGLPQSLIDIAIPPMRPDEEAREQRIEVRRTGGRQG